MSDMKRLLSGAYMLGYIDARNDKAIDPIGAIERLTMNLNKSDLISRQDAIDAFANYIHKVDKLIGTGTLSAYDCKDVARSVLDELPSAEVRTADLIKKIKQLEPLNNSDCPQWVLNVIKGEVK